MQLVRAGRTGQKATEAPGTEDGPLKGLTLACDHPVPGNRSISSSLKQKIDSLAEIY